MYELIQRQVLGSTAATITFSSIPQEYTDLLILTSFRSASTNSEDCYIQFNGDTAGNYLFRRLYGGGSGTAASDAVSGAATAARISRVIGTNYTSNTFSNDSVYIANYRANSAKSISVETVEENNATGSYQMIYASQWTGTAAITSLSINILSGASFAAGSSATLYGINRRTAIGRSPQAMGGYINYANGYWYHTFTGSGSFIPFNNMQVEYLIIGGGGGAARFRGGGGGAGGYRCSVVGEYSGGNLPAEPMMSLTANVNYPVIVGAGGAGNPNSAQGVGGNGTDSSFNSVIGTGGGGGGGSGDANTALSGVAGGSGGGGGASDNAGSSGGGLAIGVATQGFVGAGGTSGGGSLDGRGGGGGGAGSAGSVGLTTGGNGGQGIISSITGTAVARAGGGGGGTDGRSVPSRLGGVAVAGGGQGNGSGQTNTAGTPNTGGGGGGGGPTAGTYGNDGAPGGSGIVIVRYKA